MSKKFLDVSGLTYVFTKIKGAISSHNTSETAHSNLFSKITPESIGAAKSSHTHTKSDITDFPSSLKNPSSLTIQTNGTTAATYDGSSAKTVNVTPSSIGLGNVSNTPDSEKYVQYATTSGSANKTKSSLVLSLNGGTTEGSNQFTFDGSTGKSVNITPSKIGAASSNHTHAKSDISGLPNVTTSTTDIAAGIDSLTSGDFYLVYE